MSSRPQPPELPPPGDSLAAFGPGRGLRGFYRQEFDRIRRDFEATGLGLNSLSERTRLIDWLSLTLWDIHFTARDYGEVALLAVGGYGRSELFPQSDVDLLFLIEDEASRERVQESISTICREMWDCGVRVSPATRTLADCARFNPDNLEFTLSLLDCRYLGGNTALFERLHDAKLPELVARESDVLLQALSEMTRTRHHRFGNTIFHLEPNLKDGPGGLRDGHVSKWMEMIIALTAGGKPEASARPSDAANEIPAAIQFLSSARCYLHYAHNRDDNNLQWTAQEELAHRGIGTGNGPAPPAEWMRLYFGHAKARYRTTLQLLDEISQARSSLYRSFQHWRSRISNSEFSVIDGRVYFQQTADAREAASVLHLFVFMAKHGVALSAEAERRIGTAHQRLAGTMPQDQLLWQHLREILTLPHAAQALRAMHSLNLLTNAVPEFGAIDLLVLRDLYHRYTVDEHTLLAIEVLHHLKQTQDETLRPFAELLPEIERPELLFLALLLHDTGKGLEGSDHVYSSLQFTQTAVERLQLSKDDAALVCFLVASHLEMSSTMRRRDIYDPATAAELAEKVATPAQLKMLTLLTLADITAVNPEALTPWKAENLWRLYTTTANYFDHSADRVRVNTEAGVETIENIIALLPLRRSQVLEFLDGLPQRYVLSHPGEQVIQHFGMATRLAADPVQLQLLPHSGQYELTVVTNDREGLFRTLAGILYGWGMDITKAAAFSNSSGVVVDSFYFKDRFRTLELNPSERMRFERSISDILSGETDLERLLQSRLRADQQPVKLTVDTRMRHDNVSSVRNSLLEVVTQDRPGLLHTISSRLSDEGCSIEVALIDTEGPLAHDVFYLTRGGQKLNEEQMRDLEWALAGELSDALPLW
ncbi:MAG TPA: HD domain-containing protein [Terriglobales bacterium]|jgi:[protein-PII] uridylyltransferase